jgi:hypothetical protein
MEKGSHHPLSFTNTKKLPASDMLIDPSAIKNALKKHKAYRGLSSN